MKKLIFLLLVPIILWGQTADFSDVDINFTALPDSEDFQYPSANDTIRATQSAKLRAFVRLLAEKVGIGMDTPGALGEFLYYDGDSTLWIALPDTMMKYINLAASTDLDTTNLATANWQTFVRRVEDNSSYVLLTAVGDTVRAIAYYPGGTDVADADVADDITVSNYLLLTASNDTVMAVVNRATETDLDTTNVATANWEDFIQIHQSTEGSGDVTKVGTPVNNQVGVWTGDGTLEGDADLTFDGDHLTVDGKVDMDTAKTNYVVPQSGDTVFVRANVKIDSGLVLDSISAVLIGKSSPNLDDDDASVEWEDAADLESDGSLSASTVADNEIDYTAVTLNDLTFDVNSTTKTEFGYLNGVTSAIQTQLGTKLAKADAADTVMAAVNRAGETDLDTTNLLTANWEDFVQGHQNEAGAGAMLAADHPDSAAAAFKREIIQLPFYSAGDTSVIATNDTLPMGRSPRAFIIDSLIVEAYGAAAPNHTFQVYHSNGTALFSSAQSVTALGETAFTTFNDNTGVSGRLYITFPATTSIPARYKFSAYAIGRWQ